MATNSRAIHVQRSDIMTGMCSGVAVAALCDRQYGQAVYVGKQCMWASSVCGQAVYVGKQCMWASSVCGQAVYVGMVSGGGLRDCLLSVGLNNCQSTYSP